MKVVKPKSLLAALLFCVLIWLFTLTGAWLPVGGGAYIHAGDALVYLAALALPLPQAMLVSAIGCAAADMTLGSAVYILPTLVLKPLLVLCARSLMRLCENPILQDALICLSGILTIVGYTAADVVIFLLRGGESGVMETVKNGVMFNSLQALFCAALFLVAAGIYRACIARRGKKDEKSA